MRTPTEIFEEVLDSYVPERHVAAYREEFQQAMHTAACTREICGLCSRVSAVGFHVPDEIWRAVMGDSQTVACVGCFARRADEKYVAWDKHIQFFPVSKRTHRKVMQDEPVPLSAPEQALADANPSTYVPPESTASTEEAFHGTCPPVTSRESFFMSSEGIVKVAQVAAFGVGLVLPPGQLVKPPRVGTGDYGAILADGRPLNLAVSGPSPTLDAEISVPAGAPRPRDQMDALREAGALRSRAEDLLQESRHRLEEVETVGDRAFDDDDFRRRRDESAERYTKDDGSRK